MSRYTASPPARTPPTFSGANSVQERAAAEREKRRREGRTITLDTYAEWTFPGYEWYNVNRVICDVLQRAAEGQVRRLMIFVPPRIGKSELVSKILPAYYLYRFPDRWVGVTSYGAELSYDFSRNARDNYRRTGGSLKSDSASVKNWETGHGGGLWAAGVGGPATGKGFHLGIIDDPVKDSIEAQSKTIRERHKDWYDSTFFTREEPGDSTIILCMTRWHQDDLAGHLLKREEDPEKAVGWTVLSLPAKRPEKPREFPPSVDVIEDWRKPGQYLKTRVGREKFRQYETSIGEYFWSALYQQTPTPGTGNLWQREWFEGEGVVFDAPPDNLRRVGYDWDTAYTDKEENSASGYVKAGVDSDGVIYILDAAWRWVEFPDLVDWMEKVDGPHYIEQKASGKSAAQAVRKRGVQAKEVEVPGGEGDKVARTRGITPIVSSGKVRFRRSILDRLLEDDQQGILKFPKGSHDDLNDMLVQALYRLTDSGSKGIPETGSVHY